jgi:hypothetical protein
LSYVPQFEQTVCGSFGRRQARFSQVTSVGAEVFHCDRRDRVLLRDIRRFGTATVSTPSALSFSVVSPVG